MDVNGINGINNVNKPVPKKEEKKTSGLEPKQADISASEALNAYGRAIVKQQKSKEELFKQKIDTAIKNAEEHLECDDERKQEYINYLIQEKQEIEEGDFDNLDESEFNEVMQTYLLNGYLNDNMALLTKLINAKDKDNNFRFKVTDIVYILETTTPENKEFVNTSVSLQDKDGNFRFGGSAIVNILSCITSENKEFVNTLMNCPDETGSNFRFDGREIASIFSNITPGNKEFVNTLVSTQDKDGNFMFDGGTIGYILSSITPENKEVVNTLVSSQDKDGNFRFDGVEIGYILSHITPENKEVVNTLVSSQDKDGNFRFDGFIIAIMGIITPKTKDIVNTLVNIKDKDNNFRFTGENIVDILRSLTPENKDILDKLINEKDKDNSFRFTGGNITSIFRSLTPENKEILDKLINEKDKGNNFRFKGGNIVDIFQSLTPENKDILDILINKESFSGDDIATTMWKANSKENIKLIKELIKQVEMKELAPQYMIVLLEQNDITLKDIKTIEHIIGKDAASGLSSDDLIVAAKFKGLLNKQNINEISQRRKKEIIRKLVAANTGVFNISDELRQYLPLLPKTQEEYCEILPSLVRSLGIETNTLSTEEINAAETEINELSKSLTKLSDEEFRALTIKQEYSNEEFIQDTFNIVKDLAPEERQKVYDYFGFELYHNKNGTDVDGKRKFSISGYSVNLNNGKKLAQIKDERTKAVVEELRPKVIRYSENNRIESNNKDIETELNEIIKIFPELRTEIGKVQHGTHEYDLFKHTLKVMQKITQNPEYEKLNNNDKKLILLAGLFHDITKPDGMADKTHSTESSFDAYYILKKMKLTRQEEIKLYTLIKSHEWFGYVNNEKLTDLQREKRMQSVAFDLQYDNLYEMSKIFTQADMKSVKADDSYFNRHIENYKKATEKITNYIAELKTSQPLMPVTPIPKASEIEKAITRVNVDGSTNIKGVYKNKDGLVIIKYNEVENEDWEKIGFPKGSISSGIKAHGFSSRGGKIQSSEDVNTGNIKFFAHGLDYSNQLAKFDAFALPDSDALLSVSYTERPESKYRFFRTQGVLLTTPTKYMHGGGETDSGSGCGKNIDEFKRNYIFGGRRESDRKYISELIKDTLGMTDEEYIQFVKENADKPFTSIEPEEVRNKIIQAFSAINSNTRKGNRAYNEMYITNPEVMGVFAYSPDDIVGDVIEFVDKQEGFLKEYAIKKDMPFIVFGD